MTREDMTLWPDVQMNSEAWQAPQVLVRELDGWMPRTDVFPFGVTLKPGQNPEELKRDIAKEVSPSPICPIPARDIRLVVNPRMDRAR